MKIGIAYANPRRQIWLTVDLPEAATIGQAIERSGVLEQFPEIDLATQKFGVFGKFGKLDTVLEDGDRIEIYRPITADPETVPRRDIAAAAAD